MSCITVDVEFAGQENGGGGRAGSVTACCEHPG